MTIRIKKSRALGSLSLTPLIDVVFLLLIFFLVATTFSEEERQLPISLPQASEAKPMISKPKDMIVNVDEQGRFFVSGSQLSQDQLYQALLQAWTNNPGQQSVIIRGDKRTTWESIAIAMNMCNKANIRDYKTAIAE